MNAISQLSVDKEAISWKCNEDYISIRCQSEIEQVFALRTSGIAVIEKGGETKRAKVFNNDGTLRFELKNPFRPEEGYEFYYFNYECNDLIVVLAGSSPDFACSIDENNGTMSSPRETR